MPVVGLIVLYYEVTPFSSHGEQGVAVAGLTLHWVDLSDLRCLNVQSRFSYYKCYQTDFFKPASSHVQMTSQ